ncbi:MAG: hypothetical protein COY40_04545 [Alphaproteobacteria bacterium CG_4_10_14_0_8_um_filter_53_9]|nr:MAG: hypothetical protein COY40_04545 [Alphaproteobacteria bacterium CG_4_10_14_0_8_um_filter_53_9]
MMDKTKFDNVFGKMILPMKPALAADNAKIEVISGEAAVVQMGASAAESKPFFGGYAEDFLGDIGFEAVQTEAPMREGLRKKL